MFNAAVVLGLMVRYYFVICKKKYLLIILAINAFHYPHFLAVSFMFESLALTCVHPLLDVWVVRQTSAACSPTRTEQFEPEPVASDWKSGRCSDET